MRRLRDLFVIGCLVSLAVSGRLTLRLIAGGMIGWAIVPSDRTTARSVRNW